MPDVAKYVDTEKAGHSRITGLGARERLAVIEATVAATTHAPRFGG